MSNRRGKIVDKLKRIFHFSGLFFRQVRGYRSILVIEAVCIALLPVIPSFLPKLLIDEFTGQRRLSFFLGVGIGLLVLSALIRWGKSAAAKRLEFLNEQASTEAALMLSKKAARLPYELTERKEILTLNEEAKNGIWQVFNFSSYAAQFLGSIGTLLSSLVILVGCIGAWILIPIALLVLTALPTNKMKPARREYLMNNASENRGFSYWVQLCFDFSTGKDIRLNQASATIIGKGRKFLDRILAINQRFYSYEGAMNGIIAVLSQLSVWSSWLVAALRALAGAITLGDVTLAATASSNIANTLNQIMASSLRLDEALYQLGRMETFLQLPESDSNGGNGRGEAHAGLASAQVISRPLPVKPHAIVFEDVSFTYPNARNPVLEHFSLVIEPDEQVSLVGVNGSGKTTLVKLLCRFYKPSAGRILYGDEDIWSLSNDGYLQNLAVVFQDFATFAYSLRSNVSASPDPDPAIDARVEAILAQAGLGEKLKTLDKGIETACQRILDEEGSGFSGGEQQKIAIARALYKGSPVVILDEPTSALDAKAEQETFEQMHRLADGKTAIYISHRLSSTRFTRRVIVLNKGRIVEEGSHNDLVRKDGLYAEMWRKQAKYYQ